MNERQDDAEALRRALYSPGATPQDLERFEALTGTTPAADEDEPLTDAAAVAAAPMTHRSRRPLLLVGAIGAAAVLIGALAVGAAVLGSDPAPAERAPTTVRISAQDRAELLGNLRDVGAAGIGAYLVTHTSPPGLGRVTRVSTVEVHGTGSGTRALVPPGVGGQAGRATVLVTAAEAGPVSWTASRLGTSGSPVVRLVPVTSRGADQAAGDLTTTTFSYGPGRRPVRLAVEVPAGVHWGAAVVFTD